MRIAIVTNHDWFFLSHRLPIALEALKRGHEVYLVAINTGKREEIEQMGINFVEIPMNPTGKNPLQELQTLLALRWVYKKIKPDVIHHVTMKASLLGCLAAKSLGIKAVVNAISGFGYAFTDGRGGLLQKAIRTEMDWAFKSKWFRFILQNPDDYELINSLHYVHESHLHLIKGSGVDLNRFAYSQASGQQPLKLLFPARILGDKGVHELVAAMNLLRDEWKGKIKLILAGDCNSTNPTTVKEDELKSVLEDGYIEWIGYKSDMAPVYTDSDIVVLPSYREGLPKSLIEACAIGRPIITTDVPGCRECVVEGYNGTMVPAKTVEPLAEAIKQFALDAEMRLRYGKNGREMAEKNFSIEYVVEEHLKIYNLLYNQK